MTYGAYHPRYTPDGQIVCKDGRFDGRPRKRLDRVTPYYVRLNKGWFIILERLLDIPANREAGTNIPGCGSRAALIEKAFGCFLRIDALARQTGYEDVDDLVTDMIAIFRDVQPSLDDTGVHDLTPSLQQLPSPEAPATSSREGSPS